MAIRPFLAMTAAEIHRTLVFPPDIAWMACHFSPYGIGLSNLPQSLPPNSILIVDDITPIRGHDPKIILQQLAQCAENVSCNGILLDFQRPGIPDITRLVEILTADLPCPVGVSHLYAEPGSFPVFLPPVPPSVPPEEHFRQWPDRELWLELALDAVEIRVTENGSVFTPLPFQRNQEKGFESEDLCCHYNCQQDEDQIKFTLWRTEGDIEALLEQAEKFGVTTAVGLYQEFSQLNVK